MIRKQIKVNYKKYTNYQQKIKYIIKWKFWLTDLLVKNIHNKKNDVVQP